LCGKIRCFRFSSPEMKCNTEMPWKIGTIRARFQTKDQSRASDSAGRQREDVYHWQRRCQGELILKAQQERKKEKRNSPITTKTKTDQELCWNSQSKERHSPWSKKSCYYWGYQEIPPRREAKRSGWTDWRYSGRVDCTENGAAKPQLQVPRRGTSPPKKK
jgi:hypothetical protein